MLVVLLVILTFIISITVDYLSKRRHKNAVIPHDQIINLSLSKLKQMLPAGVFLQPSFTWGKILDTGNLRLGIHPILMGLLGESNVVEARSQGEHIKKGETLIKLMQDSKELHVKSPVTGTVAYINSDVKESSWKKLSKTWVYDIEPENISADITTWLIGEKSSEWLNEKFQQIKNFFIQSLPQKQMGLTMADGGELPVGVLSKFDNETWQDFEKKFIS